ncbi:phospho-N-acetylmuramoyl-pentapeptide-transferase [Patescibacteria group bacterium]|nr:phospho-N-acetylmuramoyl-pentapeptide-transferase [Patescibacteria group bacterium]MBU1703677.1 phospho-N-acetylmuramoyl-pentapeptide-transferase [Patescibacteria group bacterium]MBU1953944.1 phospho-N-acetylmuramoyl-pentapeptide-transferase [Patescibacteria group bacterium]
MDLISNIRHLSLIFSSEIFAFLLAILLAPGFIKLLHKYKCSKQIREMASTGEIASIFQSLHAKKKGIPTMGGILIWGTVLIITLASFIPSYLGITNSSLISREETWLPLFTLITTALLGAVDDWFNIKGLGKSKGLNIKPKFLWLTVFALAGALWFHFRLGYDQIHVPGIGDILIDLWYIPLFILVITATANAVNITDGLDGLAGGLLIIAFGSFSIIAFAQGLFILAAFCAVIVGALLGFIWFNIFPAHFIMGDTGAISLGATLGVIAMMTDSVAVLPLIGFIFVIETLSVIIQLTSKKFFGKKVFLIAPLHHHFEKKGWSEPNIVMRFWIIGGFLASLGLILGLLASTGM